MRRPFHHVSVDRSDNVSFVIHRMAHSVLISDIITAIGKVTQTNILRYLGLNLAHPLVYSDTNLGIYLLKCIC